MPIRSLLWIGRARRFAGDWIADAPSLDVTWERNLELGLAHSFDALDAVLLDVDEAPDGLRDLARLRRERPDCPVIVRIADPPDGDPEPWLAAGAHAVLPHDLRAEDGTPSRQLADCLERVLLTRKGRTRPRRRAREAVAPAAGIVGSSAEMRRLFALIERAGRSNATVLVSGETGTGKELIARAVHAASPRREHELVAFNCAAFPDALLESELYGHAKGAFTGADRDKRGLFETADLGTLFLDEISETSGPFQAKLLRVLQEREVRAVGSTRARHVDVRVIAASNRDLQAEVHAGRFREDLYYRLAVFPIHVPPLRERSGDVATLAEHFLAHHGRREHKPGVRLSEEAALHLASHRWPGNVRELENEIQRALALAEPGDRLEPADFPLGLSLALPSETAVVQPGETLRESMQRLESLLLRRALKVHRGRRAATARTLGITREGLWRKLKRYGIE